MIGIPWAPTDPETGTITCPVCGLVIGEAYDEDGERETNRYGEHYEAEHLSPLSADVRDSLGRAALTLRDNGETTAAIVERLSASRLLRDGEREAVGKYVRWVLND